MTAADCTSCCWIPTGYTTVPDTRACRCSTKPTWEWIRRDLDRNRDKPTIVALHEPVHPPTFLDAPRLRGLLDRHPHVVAVLQGHLHVDLEFRRHGTTYLVAPSLGWTPSPAMKLVQVYPAGLVVRTIRDSQANGRFEMTSRCQEIAIPEIAPRPAAQASRCSSCEGQLRLRSGPPHRGRSRPGGPAGELLTNAVEMLWPWK